jgi:hypothetical protein
MSEFYNNFHNINNEYDTLDKLARQINNKEKIQKNNLFNQVKHESNEEEKRWAKGIDTIINSNNFSYLPMNKNYQNQLYSSNVDEYSDNASDNASDNNFSSDKSSDEYSNIDSETLDSYLDSVSVDFENNKKINNINKNVNKNVNKNNFAKIVESLHYDECSRDSDNIFDHIKNCLNCKNKLLKFLNYNSNKSNKSDNEIIDYGKSLFAKTNMGSKEIITIIMLGLFIIFIMDILMRTKRY